MASFRSTQREEKSLNSEKIREQVLALFAALTDCLIYFCSIGIKAHINNF